MSTSVRLDDHSAAGSPNTDDERPVLRGSWDQGEDLLDEQQQPETTASQPALLAAASHLQFEDHYSLGLTPSASVVFRGRRIVATVQPQFSPSIRSISSFVPSQ